MAYSFDNIKIIKRKKNKIICFSFIQNNQTYFAKLLHTDLQDDFNRERDINIYIQNNLQDFRYHTKMIEVFENIELNNSLSILVDNSKDNYNLMIFEHSGNHTLRYYINKISSYTFQNILKQLEDATKMLEDINVIHYDLYCESNVMLKKEKKEWNEKIVDFGLSYIDPTDKSKRDYNNVIDSIKYFNKKHSI